MRVLICGDRHWTDRDTIRSWLDKLNDWGYDVLIEGEAAGADTIAKEEAIRRGMKYLQFPAMWASYGRAAGPIRNRQMLDEGKPDLVVAFHHNILESKGTKNMIEQAKGRGLEVILVEE